MQLTTFRKLVRFAQVVVQWIGNPKAVILRLIIDFRNAYKFCSDILY